MAQNTPIHTCVCKELCAFELNISKPSNQRRLWRASVICGAILKTQGLRPKPVYLRSPKEQLVRVRTGAQLPGREAEPSNSCCLPSPTRGRGWQRGRKRSPGCTRNSVEDGGYLSAFYKQTQNTETPSVLRSSPSLWGCAHLLLGVLREPLHVFPLFWSR